MSPMKSRDKDKVCILRVAMSLFRTCSMIVGMQKQGQPGGFRLEADHHVAIGSPISPILPLYPSSNPPPCQSLLCHHYGSAVTRPLPRRHTELLGNARRVARGGQAGL